MATTMDPISYLYALYFWDIGPLFWALLEVQVGMLPNTGVIYNTNYKGL